MQEENETKREENGKMKQKKCKSENVRMDGTAVPRVV